MKIHTKIITTAILIAGLGSGSYYTYNEFNKLEDKNKKLTDQVNSLSETIVNKDKLISEYKINEKKLNEQVKSQSDEIEVLNKTIENKNTSIHSLKQQLEKATKRNELPRTVSRGTNSNVKKTLYVEATAYTALDGNQIGITATGFDVRNSIHVDGLKVIATDPRVIPMYSLVKVYPNGSQPFLAIALDTGGEIKNLKADILVATKSEAKQFGRQKGVKIEVLRIGKRE